MSIHTGGARPTGFLIGTDLSSAIRDAGIGVNVGCRIAEHWSVSARACVYPFSINPVLNTTTAEHYQETGRRFISTSSVVGLHESGASLRYWTRDVFSGPMLGAGLLHRNHTGTDLYIEAGCMIRIWRGFAATVTYEKDVIGSAEEERTSGREIKIGLNYIF